MEIKEILKGNYWKIRKKDIKKDLLDFLSYFFDIYEDEDFIKEKDKFEMFYILKKKKKFC